MVTVRHISSNSPNSYPKLLIFQHLIKKVVI